MQDPAEPSTDLVERSRTGTARLVRRQHRTVVLATAVVAVLAPILFWAHGPAFGVLLLGIGVLAVAGIGLLVVRPWLLRAQRAGSSDESTVAFYRAEIDRSIRAIRQAAPFVWITVGLVTVATTLVAAGALRDMGQGRRFAFRTDILNVILLVVLIIMTLYTVRVRLPQLERERRDLEA